MKSKGNLITIALTILVILIIGLLVLTGPKQEITGKVLSSEYGGGGGGTSNIAGIGITRAITAKVEPDGRIRVT